MLTIEFANCLTERVGPHGLDPDSLAPASHSAQRVRDWTRRLESTRGQGWERWRLLPHDPLRAEHLALVRDAVRKCAGRFDNLVVLGIGGSALGNSALHAALNPPTWNLLPPGPAPHARPGPRLFVLDNVDPAHFHATLGWLDRHGGGLGRTLFNVISKSGETAETAAQFMIVRDLLAQTLGQKQHADHVLAITDPTKGTMRALCDKAGYATLPVPDGVGGRFSALSPVGLFSAAMCGIDIEALLHGAAEMDERCRTPDLAKNPAAMLATLLVRLGRERGKAIHVLMPYSNALYLMADWYRQLWAESLGKRVDSAGREVFAGFTPVKALGATDQHSQVQLYREGPNDKVIGLIGVEDFGESAPIPRGLGVDALAYLEGSSLGALLNAERIATEYALTHSHRPNYTIRMPRIDARHVGQFMWLWQMATAYAGLMLDIDAYNQPAVELGKQATYGLMGKRGFEEWKAKVQASGGAGSWTV